MSIESLCTGDTVTIQTESNTQGGTFVNTPTYTDAAASTDCRIDTVRGQEALAYASRGMKFSHQVFFASDVNLTTKNRLKWTASEGVTFPAARFLRVLDYYFEGRPGEAMLWIADCEHVTTRKES